MRISVIVPVKTYSRAKTRLDVPPRVREEICHIMLREVLRTLAESPLVHETVVVTREGRARSLGEEVGATVLRDVEVGVNEAVALADAYLAGKGAAMSLVIPQDIPLMRDRDIGFLLKFFTPPTCVLVVPSQRLDGTNALLRCPPDVMGTHYDDDSYRSHMRMARQATPNPGLVHVPRMMRDVDTVEDLDHVLRDGAKPELGLRISRLLSSGGVSGAP
ncbi:MAG: 2-phospho-L-lactate guanylyltransferase [Thaumarchaeota archaeon]|nr:2-phospho-L-lactate guanylyltransferase [Nitrososphaerota archaeon]